MTPEPEEQWEQRRRYIAAQNGNVTPEANQAAEYEADGSFRYPCAVGNSGWNMSLSSRQKRPYFNAPDKESTYAIPPELVQNVHQNLSPSQILELLANDIAGFSKRYEGDKLVLNKPTGEIVWVPVNWDRVGNILIHLRPQVIEEDRAVIDALLHQLNILQKWAAPPTSSPVVEERIATTDKTDTTKPAVQPPAQAAPADWRARANMNGH